jgi:endonuclease-3
MLFSGTPLSLVCNASSSFLEEKNWFFCRRHRHWQQQMKLQQFCRCFYFSTIISTASPFRHVSTFSKLVPSLIIHRRPSLTFMGNNNMPGRSITRRSVSTTTRTTVATPSQTITKTTLATTQLLAEAHDDEKKVHTPPQHSRRHSKRQQQQDDMDVVVTPSPRKKKRSTITRGNAAVASKSPVVTPDTTSAEETVNVSVNKTVKKTVAKKAAVTKKVTKKKTASTFTHKPPDNWRDVYSLVQELRRDRTAPCDAEGAEALPEPNLDPKVFRFQTLVALMLSSQTKDAMVGQAMRRLQQHGLTVENLHPNVTPTDKLKELIYGVGFHNNKTKFIHQVVLILQEKYDGDIPPTASEMIKELPGVGPKMAYIVENICWDTQSGIGVDTHMHRLFPLLGFVNRDVKTPEQTRQQLESWLPREHWKDVNLLFVGFGQEVQQEKAKVFRKALDCSRPYEALKLLQKVGINIRNEADSNGWREEMEQILKAGKSRSQE